MEGESRPVADGEVHQQSNNNSHNNNDDNDDNGGGGGGNMRLGGRVNGQADGGGRSDAGGIVMGPESSNTRPRIHIAMGEALLESMGNVAVSNEVEIMVNRSRGRDGEMNGGQEVEGEALDERSSERKMETVGNTHTATSGRTNDDQDTPDFRQALKAGSAIDARDGDNMWYEAMVEGTTSSRDRLIVRFLGWSRKWNATLPRSSDRIAPRNSKVPDWRQTLTTGKCVEVSSDSSTWCTAVVANVDRENERFQVIRAPACTTEWHDMSSPLIAEPYTHCGYKIEADAQERRRMLSARRQLFLREEKACVKQKAIVAEAAVARDIASALTDEALCDITFIVGSQRFKAHRVICCCRSEYFRSMLLGGMKESSQSEIHIPDVTPRAFGDILRYIYGGSVNMGSEYLLELVHAAEMFCLESFAHSLKEHLMQIISQTNAIEVLLSTDAYNMPEIKSKCIDCIICNYEEFVASNAFQKLSEHPSLLLEIMQQIHRPKLRKPKAAVKGSPSRAPGAPTAPQTGLLRSAPSQQRNRSRS